MGKQTYGLLMVVALVVGCSRIPQKSQPVEERDMGLNAINERVSTAYAKMVKATEAQGVPPPILHADGGIEPIPFTLRILEPDWDSRSVPLMYIHGTDLPEPYLSFSARGNARTPEAITELLRKHGVTTETPLPALFMGFTALHLAAASNNAAGVTVLVQQAGADPTTTNAFGDTPLHVACMEGSWDAARALLAEDRTSLQVRNAMGLTPLGVSALANRPAGIELLAASGAVLISESSSDLTDWRKSCELLIAARRGHAEFCRKSLQTFAVSSALAQEVEALLAGAAKQR